MHLLTTLSEPLIYLVAFVTIFAETGIVACFFLPGDTLLFSLGLFAHQHLINLGILIPVLVVAAFLGNISGYWFGSLVRTKRDSSKILRKIPEKHIQRTEAFYKKYGAWTVAVSRFVPIVRTIAPFLAGISRMNRKSFTALSFIGALAWVAIIPLIGFGFGSYIPLAYIGYISLGLMALASILTPLAVVLSRRYFKKG